MSGNSFTLKFVLVGDSRVGKTQLSARFCSNKYSNVYKTTERLQFSSKEFHFKNLNLTAQLWDTAGVTRPEGMTKAYFKDSVGVILVYDVTNETSFINIQKIWIPQVKAFAPADMPLILLANKVDHFNDGPRVVDANSGFALASEYSMNYLDCSAETGFNVDTAFRRIIFSVAGVFPDIKKIMLKDALPSGWLTLGTANDEDGNDEYCNVWTGETISETPVEDASVFPEGNSEVDSFKLLEVTYRESFFNRIKNTNKNESSDVNVPAISFVSETSRGNASTRDSAEQSNEIKVGQVNQSSACGQCVIS